MKKILLLSISIGIFVFVAGCNTNTPNQFQSSSSQSSVKQNTGNNQITIDIRDFKFSPFEVTIASGTIITWTNYDKMYHTVTAVDKSFDSGEILFESKFTYKFTKRGVYDYICTPHPNMKGRVIVE